MISVAFSAEDVARRTSSEAIIVVRALLVRRLDTYTQGAAKVLKQYYRRKESFAMLGTPAAGKGYRAHPVWRGMCSGRRIKPDAVFSVGGLARSGWRLSNVPRAPLLVELIKPTTSCAVVASCPAACPCAETPCSDCTCSPDLLALAACSRAVSRVHPCDGGKRCEDSMQLGAHLRCDSLRARVCPFSLRCRQKPASRPALCKLPLSTVQPNVGFGDVRVVFLVRCAHRVDVVPSLRRFRRCARASRLGRACDFAP